VPDNKAILVAFSSPASPEQAEEFTTWYEGTHIPEVRANVPGIVDVQRYALVDPAAADGPTQRFMALYFLEGDVTAAAGALGAAAAGGKLTMTSAMDVSNDPSVLHWGTRI
jgi:hypothetical protein